jgi:hypothetical protein
MGGGFKVGRNLPLLLAPDDWVVTFSPVCFDLIARLNLPAPGGRT